MASKCHRADGAARALRVLWATLTTFVITACGGGGGSTSVQVSITVPTTAPTFATNWSAVRLGGTVSGAAFVYALNTATGVRVDGYVNYVAGQGTWFADVGLLPGNNAVIVTADSDGTGTRTATATITVTRPLQPASMILNGSDAATATTYWVDQYSFGSSHVLALYADGTGRATTGNALTEPAGPVASFSWTYEAVDAVRIDGCPTCSFQRITHISGATADGLFYGQIETVGGDTDSALHAFQLTAGSP
ncbi:hypothetical protein [Azohydromonas sediminis]|uniref:hypothetical protein n=1 Tax=Azohydromonas sediminis TaxID=2259674 RepID=UPI0013C36B43|nr:hypothetical protein [Azohydromonas sediminis]